MSRDIIVQDIPAGVANVAAKPDDWMPTALPYSHADFVAAVVEIASRAGRNSENRSGRECLVTLILSDYLADFRFQATSGQK